jgi:hypothetical protein
MRGQLGRTAGNRPKRYGQSAMASICPQPIPTDEAAMPSTNRIRAWASAAYAAIFLLGIWFADQFPHVAAHHWPAVELVYGSLAALSATLSFWLWAAAK